MKKIQINETLLACIVIFIFLIGIYIYTSRQDEGSSPAEYIPTNADSSISSVFDDGSRLGLIDTSPEVGYKTGLVNIPELKWKNTTIDEKGPRVSIDIQYPQFIGGEPVKKVNEHIEKIINEVIVEDRIKLKELVRDYPDEFGSSLSLAGVYRILGVTSGILSLELVITDFTGGGNGNHDATYNINWDLKSNKLLTVEEIFCSNNYIQTLTPLIRERIASDLEKEIDGPIDEKMIDWIKEGTGSDEPYWNNVLVKGDGIIMMFPPYSVSAGAFGIRRAFIPYSSIPNLVCIP